MKPFLMFILSYHFFALSVYAQCPQLSQQGDTIQFMPQYLPRENRIVILAYDSVEHRSLHHYGMLATILEREFHLKTVNEPLVNLLVNVTITNAWEQTN